MDPTVRPWDDSLLLDCNLPPQNLTHVDRATHLPYSRLPTKPQEATMSKRIKNLTDLPSFRGHV